jgi:hypothetical protein
LIGRTSGRVDAQKREVRHGFGIAHGERIFLSADREPASDVRGGERGDEDRDRLQGPEQDAATSIRGPVKRSEFRIEQNGAHDRGGDRHGEQTDEWLEGKRFVHFAKSRCRKRGVRATACSKDDGKSPGMSNREGTNSITLSSDPCDEVRNEVAGRTRVSTTGRKVDRVADLDVHSGWNADASQMA